MEPPKWFFEKPELDPGQEAYLLAFDRLSSCRQMGSGAIGRIPWTATMNYAEVHGYDFEDYLILDHVIHLLDGHYIEWVAKHVKEKGSADA